MLRVVRLLRTLLLGVGVASLLWLPASFFVAIDAGTRYDGIRGECGMLMIRYPYRERPPTNSFEPSVSFDKPWGGQSLRRIILPDFNLWDWIPIRHVAVVTLRVISIPLWLLACLCLAWPVTSLLLARRRRKGRGFAVEAGGGGPAPGIDP